jgi:hypothetical protein
MTDKEREILERLEAQGVKVGQWKQQGAREIRPQLSGNMKSLLGELKKALEAQIQEDVRMVQQLREVANKARYGGGR